MQVQAGWARGDKSLAASEETKRMPACLSEACSAFVPGCQLAQTTANYEISQRRNGSFELGHDPVRERRAVCSDGSPAFVHVKVVDCFFCEEGDCKEGGFDSRVDWRGAILARWRSRARKFVKRGWTAAGVVTLLLGLLCCGRRDTGIAEVDR